VLLLFDCWEERPTTNQAGQHAFVQAVKLWINKAKDRLRQGDYWAIRGQLNARCSTVLIPDDQDSRIDAGVAAMSENPLEFYDGVPDLPGHMPPIEEPTALGGRSNS
jgi:hypothetical protein